MICTTVGWGRLTESKNFYASTLNQCQNFLTGNHKIEYLMFLENNCVNILKHREYHIVLRNSGLSKRHKTDWGIFNSEGVKECFAGTLISVFSRRHPPTSLAGSESAHFDPGGVCGSYVNPEETHQWADLPVHRLPRWRERCMSGRKEQPSWQVPGRTSLSFVIRRRAERRL